MSVIEEITAERARQISSEGWTPEHDDEHSTGALAMAASCYAAASAVVTQNPHALYKTTQYAPEPGWPWAERWWKFTEPRRALIKAAALIVAEIERIDRARTKATASK